MYFYMFASVYIHGYLSDEERIWKIVNCLKCIKLLTVRW